MVQLYLKNFVIERHICVCLDSRRILCNLPHSNLMKQISRYLGIRIVLFVQNVSIPIPKTCTYKNTVHMLNYVFFVGINQKHLSSTRLVIIHLYKKFVIKKIKEKNHNMNRMVMLMLLCHDQISSTSRC